MVTLLPWKSNSVHPENNLEVGGVQVEEHSGENTEEKVHAPHSTHSTHSEENILHKKFILVRSHALVK